MDSNLKKAQELIGQEYIKALTLELIRADKKSTGVLINSLSYQVIEKADEYILQISSADYLKYFDGGRRKGAKPPPVKAILPWVKARGIRFGKTDEQTAFIVARGISKNGIKPTKDLEKAKTQLMKNIEDILVKASVQDIERIIEEQLKEL